MLTGAYTGSMLCIVTMVVDCNAISPLYNTIQDFCATALTVTCEVGHVKVARILVQSGAAVNYQDKVNCA